MSERSSVKAFILAWIFNPTTPYKTWAPIDSSISDQLRIVHRFAQKRQHAAKTFNRLVNQGVAQFELVEE